MTLSPFALHVHQFSNLVVMIAVMFGAVVMQPCLLVLGLALAVAPSQQVVSPSAAARRGRYGLVAAS